MQQHSGVGGLEAEDEDAVECHGQGADEREASRPAVDPPDDLTRQRDHVRQPAVDARRRCHLDDRQGHRRRGEPGLCRYRRREHAGDDVRVGAAGTQDEAGQLRFAAYSLRSGHVERRTVPVPSRAGRHPRRAVRCRDGGDRRARRRAPRAARHPGGRRRGGRGRAPRRLLPRRDDLRADLRRLAMASSARAAGSARSSPGRPSASPWSSRSSAAGAA